MSSPQYGQQTDFGAFLSQQAQVVLNGSGYGTVSLTPHGENWRISSTTVRVSTRVLEAVSNSYRGLVGAAYLIEATNSGSTGDTSNSDIFLRDGETLIIEWTGGDVGATATATITGWRSTPAGGFRAQGA